MPTCPNCENETAAGAVFCDQCGTQIPASGSAVPDAPPAPAGGSMICPACGAGNVPGEAFCDFCGSPLDAPVPAVAEAPELAPAEAEVVADAVPGEDQSICPACGTEVQPGEAFCANCGASIAEPKQASEAGDVVELVEEVPAAVDRQVLEAREAVEPPTEGLPLAADRQVPEAREAVAPVAEDAPVVADRQVPEAREVVVEEATLPPPALEPVAVPACPACGVDIVAGDKFCSNCGAVLQVVAEPAAAEVEPLPSPSAGPRLVVVASGAEIPLPAGDEVLIGREDPVSGVFPQVDLTPHGGEAGGVSRRHARLIVKGFSYSVEDLDSTNFTFVNKQKLAPGTNHPVSDGDEIRCGRVALVLRT